MARRILSLALCGLAAVRGEDHWAVLVAGSSGFWNYRHQADVCHAYHVLTSRGFNPDHIITMLFDDVANAKANPLPGKLFNFPWKKMAHARDVYEGCQIDYREGDVTPAKFQAVLTGDAETAGGKVLQSKADDHVFINFVDHGAVGLIAFPVGVMHAKDLIGTLKAMHDKGMYGKLTFYLETCESGSMFQGLLPKKLPVYAVTAANGKESSWGTFCGKDAKVGGTAINSCLGDLFSVNWMMDSDHHKKRHEELKTQFRRVKNMTDKSHVMEYGQVHHFGKEQINDFLGPADSEAEAAPEYDEVSHASAVDSREAKLVYLQDAHRRSGSDEAGEQLIEHIRARSAVQALDATLGASLTGAFGEQVVSDEVEWTGDLLDCHWRAAMAFEATCGWSEERLPLSKTLYRLCVLTSGNAQPVAAAVRSACSSGAAEIVV